MPTNEPVTSMLECQCDRCRRYMNMYSLRNTDFTSFCDYCPTQVAGPMHACEICAATVCAACQPGHEHNGGYCEDHGYNMLNNESTLSCYPCSVYSCEDHFADYHTECGRDQQPHMSEREAYIGHLDEDYIAHTLVPYQRASAVELEAEWGSSGQQPLNLPNEYGIAHDGSLNEGIEITTPPAKGAHFANIITRACDAMREAGYVADGEFTAGTHVHIDLRDKENDTKFLSHLYNAYFAVEDILFAMQNPSRHGGHYSIPLRNNYAFYDMYGQRSGDFDWTFYKMKKSAHALASLNRDKRGKYASVRYSAFNFHSVYYRGSLEIRLMAGTLDAERILNWVALNQAIIAKVEKGHSYKWARRMAGMKVTTRKVNDFIRYFDLSDKLAAFVRYGVEHGQGYNFSLPRGVEWGTPIKGRPTGMPEHEHAGRFVLCYSCSHRWRFRGNEHACPHCSRSLTDTWGDRNYSLEPRRTTLNRIRRAERLNESAPEYFSGVRTSPMRTLDELTNIFTSMSDTYSPSYVEDEF